MSDAAEHMSNLSLIGGAVCLDFANTGSAIKDYADLVAWIQRVNALDGARAAGLNSLAASDPGAAQHVFEEAISLREVIHRLFTMQATGDVPLEADLKMLSELVSAAARHRTLQRSDDGYFWDWDPGALHLSVPNWIVARSATDLLTSDLQSWTRQCASDDCDWLFVDTSRNRSRRWCDMAECGNRAKARRNYARKRLTKRTQEP